MIDQFQDVAPGCVAYTTGFIDCVEAITMLETLKASVPWRQEHLKFDANKIPLPRFTAWYGDPGARYFYSGIHNEPSPWPDGPISQLRDGCNLLFPERPFNSVLLNWYRSGNDSIGYHVDNENDLLYNSTIATVSLGASRTFRLKGREGRGDVRTVIVENGSLLLMYGDCQRRWLHGIPKEPSAKGDRISLTFRTVRIR